LKKLEERGVVIRFVIGRRFFHALIHTGYDINTYFLENLMINYLHYESYFTFKFVIDSPNRGDSLDRNINEENRSTKDFLILVSKVFCVI